MTSFHGLLFISVLSAFSLVACGPKSTTPSVERSAEPTPKPNPQPAPQASTPDAVPPTSEVTLTGTLAEGGESRGKTIAAWNGVPVGETFYWFQPDAGEPLVDGASERFMLRVPSKEEADVLVTKRVRITGQWNVPEPVEYNPMEPRQVPITAGPDGSTRIEQPDVTFTATSLVEAS